MVRVRSARSARVSNLIGHFVACVHIRRGFQCSFDQDQAFASPPAAQGNAFLSSPCHVGSLQHPWLVTVTKLDWGNNTKSTEHSVGHSVASGNAVLLRLVGPWGYYSSIKTVETYHHQLQVAD